MNPLLLSRGSYVGPDIAPAEVISYVGSSTRILTTNTTNFTLTPPATAAVGDLGVMSVAYYGTLTPYTGWTLFGTEQVLPGTRRLAHYWKILTAADLSARTWTQGASSYVNYAMTVWRAGQTLALKGAVTGSGVDIRSIPVQTTPLLTNGRWAVVVNHASLATSQFPSSWALSEPTDWAFAGGSGQASYVQRTMFAYKQVSNQFDVGGIATFAPYDGNNRDWASTTLVIGYA